MAKRKTTSRKPATKRKSKKKKSSWFYWLLLPIGVAAFFVFWYKADKQLQTSAKFHEIVPKGYKSIGIDVSHHQGEIDWDMLLEDGHFDTIIDFVYCKATEGSDHIDTEFARNREILNAKGIHNGAYHYFNPKAAPRPQADHFLSIYKHRTIDMAPVLDVEDEGFSDEDLIAKIKIWAEVVQQRTGMKPVIYTSLSFYETKFRGKLDGFQYWIAAYSREPEYMSDPNVIHWQFSEDGKLPGINESVDLNVSNQSFF